MAHLVKNLPAMWETRIQCLGWEDALEWEKLLTPLFWHGLSQSQTLQTVRVSDFPFTN